jgi:hypothetical protein
VYSMKYSASLTAAVALAVAVCALYLWSKNYWMLVGWVITGSLVIGAALSAGSLGPSLTGRLESLGQNLHRYETLQTRETQFEETLDRMGIGTVLVGDGYSTASLPDHKDIHNGLLAALFHFGLLGLASQFLLLWFFVSRLWTEAPRSLKSIAIGCIIVFSGTYLSGPGLARRSLWIPMFMIGAYLRVDATCRRTSGVFHGPMQLKGLGGTVTSAQVRRYVTNTNNSLDRIPPASAEHTSCGGILS